MRLASLSVGKVIAKVQLAIQKSLVCITALLQLLSTLIMRETKLKDSVLCVIIISINMEKPVGL